MAPRTNRDTDPLVPSQITVKCVDGEYQVIALADLEPGTTILEVEGPVVARPSRYSIQVGPQAHVHPPVSECFEVDLDHHQWRFMNHHCAPNATLRGRTLVAARPIRRGDEVTFDYHTTEYELASPFACTCDATDCLGVIRGYRYLSPAQRRRIEQHVANHLRQYGELEGTPPDLIGAPAAP